MPAIWQKVMETHKCPARRARPHATHDQTRRSARFSALAISAGWLTQFRGSVWSSVSRAMRSRAGAGLDVEGSSVLSELRRGMAGRRMAMKSRDRAVNGGVGSLMGGSEGWGGGRFK